MLTSAPWQPPAGHPSQPRKMHTHAHARAQAHTTIPDPPTCAMSFRFDISGSGSSTAPLLPGGSPPMPIGPTSAGGQGGARPADVGPAPERCAAGRQHLWAAQPRPAAQQQQWQQWQWQQQQREWQAWQRRRRQQQLSSTARQLLRNSSRLNIQAHTAGLALPAACTTTHRQSAPTAPSAPQRPCHPCRCPCRQLGAAPAQTRRPRQAHAGRAGHRRRHARREGCRSPARAAAAPRCGCSRAPPARSAGGQHAAGMSIQGRGQQRRRQQ